MTDQAMGGERLQPSLSRGSTREAQQRAKENCSAPGDFFRPPRPHRLPAKPRLTRWAAVFRCSAARPFGHV